MTNTRFLSKLSATIIQNHGNSLLDLVIILPNKRAKVFLIEELQKQLTKTIFSPTICSVEDFVSDLSGISAIDTIDLLFEFYDVYLAETQKSKQQSFDVFANWAKTLLQDFNEIDRYLLDPSHVLSYIKDIEDIKKWGIETEDSTKLLENYVDFWKLLPNYYQKLYSHLVLKKKGYQGLIYREAVQNLSNYCNAISPKKHFIFAGFNALNAAEEKIVQFLLKENLATIYWDVDKSFFKDLFHDTALFSRRFYDKWSYYKSNTFDWIVDDFSQNKNIQIIGTSKSIGQAKIAGAIIEDLLVGYPDFSLKNMALVLGDENLLLPVLHSLPNSVGSLNITMGYPSKNNPAQILVAKLFKMHTNALSRKGKAYVFYYKDVLDVLSHPLVSNLANTKNTIDIIIANNYTFISLDTLLHLQKFPNEVFLLLFSKWEDSCVSVLNAITSILLAIKETLTKEEDSLSKAFLFSVFTTINKLSNYFTTHASFDSVQTLFSIYKQLVDLAEVSFEGEPLKGLQIMGVLESRVLDFDTVIITSMNEGKFPAGKSQQSFIPYDVKRELGLPTFKEKDAIYTYHFYHLLQRAKNIYLLYSTDTEGFDAGEKSRFLTQLEVEKQVNHTITHTIYNSIVPQQTTNSVSIEKSELVQKRLRDIAKQGFSPSAITSYLRNPIDFYYQKILRIRETEEVEETIALNTLGTIIHETLKAIYEPLLNKILLVSDIQNAQKLVADEVLNQFKLVYKQGEITKGRNFLAFEVAKRNVQNFLKTELEAIKNGDEIKIIALEETFEKVLNHPLLPFPVLIKGNVDRIEKRNGILRIIDYKTGKVEKSGLVLNNWEAIMDIKNDKIIQVLAYAFMYQKQTNPLPLEAGIISFKNLKSGFLPFTFKINKTESTAITPETLDNFVHQLATLIAEILNPEIPFQQNT